MTKHPNPIIFIRGTEIEDLKAMLDFIYYGEAKVFQENLTSFLALGEEFKVEGLMESSVKKDIENAINVKTQSKTCSNKIKFVIENQTQDNLLADENEAETVNKLEEGIFG